MQSDSLDRGSERRGLKNLALHAPSRIQSHNINDRAIENRAGTKTNLLFEICSITLPEGHKHSGAQNVSNNI